MGSRKIRDILAWGFAVTLIAFGFTRRAKKRSFQNGEILCIYFHNPERKLLEKCVNWLLKNKFVILSADELVEIFKNKAVPPKGAVWLSFDDGWKNNITDAVPYLAEKKIPATFFISTEPVESSGVFWWTCAEKYKDMLPQKFREDFGLLWKVPEKERKEVIAKLYSDLKKLPQREALTVEDIKQMAQYDFITIGSHTVNHVITINCSDEELEYELCESKRKLEEWTGKKAGIFSYPNGDYGNREAEAVKKAGYNLAVIGEEKAAFPEDNIYKIPRLGVGNAAFAEELCHMLGVWQRAMKKIKFK